MLTTQHTNLTNLSGGCRYPFMSLLEAFIKA